MSDSRLIKHLMLRDILLVLGLEVGMVLLLAWAIFIPAVGLQAHRQAEISLGQLAMAMTSYLKRQETAASAMAALRVAGAISLERPTETHRNLAGLGSQLQGIRGIGFLEQGKGWVDVARRSDGWQTTVCRGDGRPFRGETWNWSADGALLAIRPKQIIEKDLTQRPWLKIGKASPTGAWTNPYPVTLNPTMRNRTGLSFAREVFTAPGQPAGVVTTFQSLDGLAEQLREFLPTPGSELLVVDDQGRAVTLPAILQDRDPGANLRCANAVGPGFLPEVANILKVARNSAWKPTVHLGKRAFFAEFRELNSLPGLHWRVYLLLPKEELVGHAMKVSILFALACALGLSFTTGWGVFLAYGFIRPLEDLERISLAMSKGESLKPPTTRIREIRRLAERFIEAAEAVRGRAVLESQRLHAQRLELIGTYASTVAHDSVNHLAVALLNLERLKENKEVNPTVLDRIDRSVAFCARLAKGLLAFSRNLDAVDEPVDLNEILENALLLTSQMVGKNVAFHLDLQADLPLVQGNALQLQQVFINLIINAAEAMDQRGQVFLRSQRVADGQVAIHLGDSGCGIPKELQAQIFEPFFSTKGPQKGSGLGLAIVKRTVDQMGGLIELESSPSAGTLFRITFPALGVDNTIANARNQQNGAATAFIDDGGA